MLRPARQPAASESSVRAAEKRAAVRKSIRLKLCQRNVQPLCFGRAVKPKWHESQSLFRTLAKVGYCWRRLQHQLVRLVGPFASWSSDQVQCLALAIRISAASPLFKELCGIGVVRWYEHSSVRHLHDQRHGSLSFDSGNLLRNWERCLGARALSLI